MRHLILALILCVVGSWAEASAPFRRSVSFEWEAIEDAKIYELEIRRAAQEASEDIDKGKKHSFKVNTPQWRGLLSPGNYLIRLRSVDHRNVPGDWSDESDFHVGLDPVSKMTPAHASRLKGKDAEKDSVTLSWEAVKGADYYELDVTDSSGQVLEKTRLEKTSHSLTLPVAQQYSWKVTAGNNRGIRSESSQIVSFAILGSNLASPKIAKPDSGFVREVRWNKPANADTYDVHLLRLDVARKKWIKVKSLENTNLESIDFESRWPGGKYQLWVRSRGNLRGTSTYAKSHFDVVSGDRSPAAEMNALVRRSIERVTGWYGIASYLITEINYSSANPEHNSAVSYSALGGTGRVGGGWFSPKKPWGFLSILDLSGFTFNGDTKTFASLELNAVYRRLVGDRGEIRLQVGPYYKELPETIGDPQTQVTTDYNIGAVGVHAGGEYWYSLTSRIGLQANIHLYMSAIGLSTPNGRELNPTLSTQIGFLGSYRFSDKFTGLIGYARREDKMSYNAGPNNTTLPSAGDKNESTVVGNYLNIFAEWAF